MLKRMPKLQPKPQPKPTLKQKIRRASEPVSGSEIPTSEHALIKIASLIRHRGDETLLEVTGIDRHPDFVDAKSGWVKTEVRHGLNEINIRGDNSPIVLSNLKQALGLIEGKLSKALLIKTNFHLVGANGTLERKERLNEIKRLFKEGGVAREPVRNPGRGLPEENTLRFAAETKKRVFGERNPHASLTPEELRHLLESGLPHSHFEPFFRVKLAQLTEKTELIKTAKKTVFGTVSVTPVEVKKIISLKLGTELPAYVAYFEKLKQALSQAKRARSKARK